MLACRNADLRAGSELDARGVVPRRARPTPRNLARTVPLCTCLGHDDGWTTGAMLGWRPDLGHLSARPPGHPRRFDQSRAQIRPQLASQDELLSAELSQQTLEHVSRRRAAICAPQSAINGPPVAHTEPPRSALARPPAVEQRSRAAQATALPPGAAPPRRNTKTKTSTPAVGSQLRNHVQDEPLHAMVLQ